MIFLRFPIFTHMVFPHFPKQLPSFLSIISRFSCCHCHNLKNTNVRGWCPHHHLPDVLIIPMIFIPWRMWGISRYSHWFINHLQHFPTSILLCKVGSNNPFGNPFLKNVPGRIKLKKESPQGFFVDEKFPTINCTPKQKLKEGLPKASFCMEKYQKSISPLQFNKGSQKDFLHGFALEMLPGYLPQKIRIPKRNYFRGNHF